MTLRFVLAALALTSMAALVSGQCSVTCRNGGVCDAAAGRCVCTPEWRGNDCSVYYLRSRIAINNSQGSCCTSIHGNVYQTFTAPRSGRLTRLDLFLGQLYYRLNYQAWIRTGWGTGGTQLAFAETGMISGDQGWKELYFTSPANLTAGQIYSINMDCPLEISGYTCGAGYGGGYGGGSSGRYGRDDFGNDLMFRLYIGDEACTSSEFATGTTFLTCNALNDCRPGSFVSRAPTETSDRLCTACSTGFTDANNLPSCKTWTAACSSFQYESVQATSSTDRVCTLISPPCDLQFFETAAPTRTSDRVCTRLRVCASDEYETVAPTRTSDRVCTKLTVCKADEFQSVAPTATTDRTCQRITVCGAGFETRVAPTNTSDRVCQSCPAGSFSLLPGTEKCTQCRTCASGNYETVPCTATSNRQCTACDMCPLGQHRIGGCVGSTNTTCEPCLTADKCRSNQYLKFPCIATELQGPVCDNCHISCETCTSAAETACRTCADGFAYDSATSRCSSSCGPKRFVLAKICTNCSSVCGDLCNGTTAFDCLSCSPTQFLHTSSLGRTCVSDCAAVNASLWSDEVSRTCKVCSVCPPGTFTRTPCGARSDTVCQPCTLDVSFQPLAGQPSCNSVTICKAGEETRSKPSLTSDRVCKACDRGFFQNIAGEERCRPVSECVQGALAKANRTETFETAAPTTSTDRICSLATFCDQDEWESRPISYSSNRVCNKITTCEAGFETAVEVTPTSDRVCRPCRVTTFQDERNQTTCKVARVCNATEFETAPRTPTSDRTCKALTVCPEGFWEFKAPTATSDRVCSNSVQYCNIFASDDEQTCQECIPGYWMATASRCEICPLGHACDGYSPDPCGPGTFQNVRGLNSCKDCAEGTAQPLFGQERCTPCFGASLAPTKGLNACKAMQRGFYGIGNTTTVGYTGETKCEPGFACANGTRTECRAGTFALEGASVCEPCGEGRYNVLTRQTGCRDITLGWFGTGERLAWSGMSPCPAGSMCVNGFKIDCPPGTWQDLTIQTTCKSCGENRFSNVTGRTTECDSISTGYFGVGRDAAQSATQQICPAGSYCLNGKKFDCGAGTFQNVPGSTVCQACPAPNCDKGLSVVNANGYCDSATGLYRCEDITPPRITLVGRADMSIEVGTPYKEPGAIVNDTRDSSADLAKRLVISGAVNSAVVGVYTLTYDCKDAAGNSAPTVRRIVRVVDTTKPYLVLIGPEIAKIVQGLQYVDSGVFVNDTGDANVKNKIITTGLPVDTRRPGTFNVTFTVTDASQNRAEVTRVVIVVDANVERQAQVAANRAYKEALGVYKGDTVRALNSAQAAYLEAGGQMDPNVAASTAKSTQENESTASSAPLAIIAGAVVAGIILIVLVVVIVKRRGSGSRVAGGKYNESKSALVGKRSVAPWMDLDHNQSVSEEVNVSAFMERVRQESVSTPKPVDYESVNYDQMSARKAWEGSTEASYETPDNKQKEIYETTKEIEVLQRKLSTRPVALNASYETPVKEQNQLYDAMNKARSLLGDELNASIKRDYEYDTTNVAVPANKASKPYSKLAVNGGQAGPVAAAQIDFSNPTGTRSNIYESNYASAKEKRRSLNLAGTGYVTNEAGEEMPGSYGQSVEIDPLVLRVETSKTMWMRPELGRAEATAFLARKAPGTFVIRNSTQTGCYAITCVALQEGKVWNGLIEQTPEGFILNKAPVKFSSLSGLVLENLKHEVAVKQCGLPCPLLLPEDDSCIV